jgi:hypothetical protein
MTRNKKTIAKDHTSLKFFVQFKHYARGNSIKIIYKETILFRQYNGIKIHFEWLKIFISTYSLRPHAS